MAAEKREYMIDIEAVKKDIVERLKPLDPVKIILFGSYAYGKTGEASDIDLIVVTRDDYIPENFKEKSAIHNKVASAMQDILQEYPTDLITHTKKMHDLFLKSDSFFAREIWDKGVVLYERCH